MKNIKLYSLVAMFLGILFSQQAIAQCTASFTAQSNSNGSVSFTNTSVGNSQYTIYSWSFGDGTSSYLSNPTHQYNTNGYVSVCLSAYDSMSNCQAVSCDTVLVSGASGATCSVGIGYQVSGSTVTFSTVQATSNIVSYQWWFGNGGTSTQSNPVYTYNNAGTYNVYLVAQFANGCVDTVSSTVTISATPNCNAQFAVASNNNGVVTFTNQSTGGTAGQSSYYWSFGNNNTLWTYSTSQIATALYNSTGIYQVCLTMIDSATGCSDNYCTTVAVQVSGGCNASFAAYDSSGYFYFFPNTAPPATYLWNFGDNTTSTSSMPIHQYNAYGTYYVCLTVQTMGMTCTYCDTVLYYGSSPCNANFTAYPDTNNIGVVYFSNSSTGSFTNVYWSFGDGSSSSSLNPVHTYSQQGTYIVCLTVYTNTGCQSSYCDSIIIGNPSGPCTPVFYAYPDSTIGNGVVNFGLINNCSNTNWTYVWNFGDGTIGTGLSPVHVFQTSGTFWVCVDAVDPNGNVLTWCDSVNSNRIGSVGLNEISKNAIIAFPNPANDQVTIKNLASNEQLEVYSMDGRLMYNTSNTTSTVVISTSSWNAGLYLLYVNDGKNKRVGKISVQH